MSAIEWVKPHNLIRYASHPVCHRCGWDQFDDWWHVLRDRRGRQPAGKLTCGDCEKQFLIEGSPGNVFSTAFGLDRTDRLLRSAQQRRPAARNALKSEGEI